jgi:hypothetical protein
VFFFALLPQGDRCLNCDAPTLRVQRAFWHRWVPVVPPSWCMECDWKGAAAQRPDHPGGHGAVADVAGPYSKKR